MPCTPTSGRRGGNAAGPYLIGLADGALRVARRRQRLARAGAGIVAAAVVTTAGVAVADGATRHAHLVQPAAGSAGNTQKAALISILPVTSSTERPCAQGSGGYTVHATATYPAFCVHVDRTRGMTGVHVTSAKADKSSVDGTWQVDVTLNSADRTRFAALAGSIAGAPAPRNQFAIVIDGELWGAPPWPPRSPAAGSTSTGPSSGTSPAPPPTTSPSGWMPAGDPHKPRPVLIAGAGRTTRTPPRRGATRLPGDRLDLAASSGAGPAMANIQRETHQGAPALIRTGKGWDLRLPATSLLPLTHAARNTSSVPGNVAPDRQPPAP